MKITKRQIQSIIRETLKQKSSIFERVGGGQSYGRPKDDMLEEDDIAIVKDEVIDDTVMGVLSDEGGAAGQEPIEDALDDLEDEDISLPDEDIAKLINDVPGVKRHRDGDFIDTTKLEGRQFNRIKESVGGSFGIFDRDYVYDMFVDEVEQVLRTGNRSPRLSPAEAAALESAVMEGLKYILQDYS